MNNDSEPGMVDFDSLLPDDENGRLLRKLREGGVDLERVHTIDFFFAFNTLDGATAFHREENEPMAVDSFFEMNGEWIVRVSKLLIPTHRSINKLQEKLIHIAAQHHGKAAGWGVSQ